MKRSTEGRAKRVIEGVTIIEDKHKPTEREVAYHEAAHVVAAIALGVSFDSVTVVPDGTYLGCVGKIAARKRGRKLIDLDVKHLIIDLAGPLAERKARLRMGAYIEPEITRALDICEGRITEAAGGYDALPEEVGSARLYKLIRRTQRVLDRHWEEVKLIAGTLLKEKTLSKRKILVLLSNQPKKSRGKQT
jgi:hypothetical protein